MLQNIILQPNCNTKTLSNQTNKVYNLQILILQAINVIDFNGICIIDSNKTYRNDSE